MNWKHLFWIVPLTLIIGGVIGFNVFGYTTDKLSDMVDTIDKCSIQTLQYVAEQNNDCQILISGYMAQCAENITIG